MGKKKKHIFSLIVIFLMILSMFPTSAFAEIDGYTGDSGQPAADSGSYIADDVQGSAEDNNTGSQDVITADDSTGTDNQTTPDADSNDTDKQDLINPAGNFGENNNVGGPGDNDRGRGDNDKDWGGDKDKDKDNSYYNHIDVRVDASLTLVSKVNGVVIKSEKVAVKTSNVSATLNGSPVTFYKKSGTGKENEWRADGLSLNPNSSTETVTVTCNLSGTKTDGSSVNVTVTKTYTGSSALWQLVNNCPGRNGYDIDIVAEDISESFTVDKTVTKVWADNNNNDSTRPSSIQIQLYADGVAYGSPVTLNTLNSWTAKFTDLPKYSTGTTEVVYTADEVTVPTGYTKSISADGMTITNTYTQQKTSVSVTKAWNDNDNNDGIRPDNVKVQLYADGTAVSGKTLTLSADNSWKGTFTDLPVYKNGKAITYTVKENAVKGYTYAVTGTAKDGFTITNTHTPETINICGSKTWADSGNNDGLRPESITVNLMNGDEVVASKTVTANDNWAWKFENVQKYKDGKEISYSIKEEAVKGYTTSYNGYNVKNTHEIEKTSISVKKTWNDSGNNDGIRPADVKVQLYADGTAVKGKTLTLSADNSWKGTFTDLPVYKNGKEITYTVKEKAVKGYTSAVEGTAADGFTITNTHVPETITICGSKTWCDSGNNDGIRPESITVNLMNGDEVVASKTVTANDGWAWKFENVQKYKDGKEISYTIKEEAVKGYTASYNGYNVKNTHEIEKTSISVTKAWNDSGNNDGIRAAEVTVQLYADGAAVSGKTLTLSKDNGWTASFTDLPVYKDGKEIVYTVKEDAVKGYTSEVTGTAKDGFTITNTHTPETITVSGAKTWADEDNNDGVRPESITVKLMNGNDVVASKTVTANDNWAWSFTGINKYKDGKEISYSIREEAVEAYTTSYDGYNVTNTHEIEKTSISVTKEWNDDGNNDGIRPETVTVQLYADGTAVEGKTLTLSEANQWTAIFEDLPVYNDGKVIEYTVEENAVDGYTATVDKTTDGGFVVTNTHESETMDISVVKEWKDGDNKDKIRPESIMVQLCVNGDPIDDQILILSDLNNWSGAFKNLPVYKEGQEISYTITENEVDGYTAEISGSAKDGFVITNRHTPGEDPTPVPPTDNTDKTVKTGDTTNVLLWAVLLAAAVLCFCGTLCFRRRNTQR